jgi:predicted flap endonuclease-1-like 5' DNA nuclease
MTYLILEILVCLLLAALIGFVVGWLWARAAGRSRLESVESDWAGRYKLLDQERNEIRSKADTALASLKTEQQALVQVKDQLSQGRSELEAAQKRIAELGKGVESWRQKTAAAEKSAAERAAESARLTGEGSELNARIAALNADQEKHTRQIAGLKGEAEAQRRQMEAQWSERVKGLEAERDAERRRAAESDERLAAEQRAHQAAKKTLDGVNAELDERGRKLAAFSTEAEDARRRQSALQTLVDQRSAAFADQEQALGTLRDRVAALHADLGARDQRILGLEKDLDALRRRIGELEGELAQRDNRLLAASQTLSTCQLDLTSLAEKTTYNRQELTGVIDQLRERVGELAPALKAREEELARLTRQLEEWEKRYEHRVGELQTCEAAVAAGQKTPANLLLRRPDEVDDIKEIRGIGPVLERVLNRLGIYLFRQIAEFTPEDIEWVSANLPEFPRRIIQERWIDQARELHAKKYGAR